MVQLSPSPSTWRLLGLSVAMGYAFLGTFEMVQPAKAAKAFFGIEAEQQQQPLREEKDMVKKGRSLSHDSSTVVSLLMPLIGARDISIAAAIVGLHLAGRPVEMGWVIVSGTFLCVTDAIVVWQRADPRMAAFMTAGLIQWTVIGIGLLYQG